MVNELDDTIRDLRTTIFAFQHDTDAARRTRASRSRARRPVRRTLGFAPRLRISGEIDTRVSPEIADHLLAVLREAISNVARHAEPHG